jgi:hypothetical protein
MLDYGGRDLGPCMTAHTNELGGRVVVAGYFPWSQIHSLAKSSQMKAVCAWLSRERLPTVVESYAKVVIWNREGAGGTKGIVVLNASLDSIDKLSLQVLSDKVRFTYVSPTRSPMELSGEPLVSPRGYVRVVLPHLPPWSAQLLVIGGA